MKPHTLIKHTEINKPITEVFDFFGKAENLNELTPPDLHFNIITPLPIAMKAGTIIDYKIRLGIIPMKWKTLISAWEPPFRFVDEQLSGPYVTWIHEHKFEYSGQKTKMTDTIQYVAPGLFLEPIVHNLFIKSKVNQIFEYREKRLKELFV